MTVFALNIMPYISASIIMQLLTVISPQLEQLKKEGKLVEKKLISMLVMELFFWLQFKVTGLLLV